MKKVKYDSFDDPLAPEIRSLSHVLPIPLYRKHTTQHSIKPQKEFTIRGHKYFSRVSAVGERTDVILKAISKCAASRMINKFEFDPYLHDKSCLMDLCKAFRKIKCLRSLNVVFRRLDRKNESDLVVPFLTKQTRLVNFRFEFPKTNNLDENGMLNFARIFGKLVSLRKIEQVVTDLENMPDSADQHLAKYMHKNIHVKELKSSTHKLAKLDAQGPPSIPSHRSKRDHQDLKKADFSYGISTGWLSENTGADSQEILRLDCVVNFQKLEHFSIKFNGSFAINELFALLVAACPVLLRLKTCCIEFLNCRISDIELITLIQILPKVPHLQQFTLKVLQHPNISKDCIYFLLKTLMRFPNLKKFDLYFRRLSLDDEEIQELLEIISGMPDLKCVCFKKESLHLSRSSLD